jgi:hypothetical protein
LVGKAPDLFAILDCERRFDRTVGSRDNPDMLLLRF